jgi:hypothetical protein
MKQPPTSQRPAGFIASLVLALALLGGCATTTKLPEFEKVAIDRKDWIGDWFSPSISYYKHESSNGIRINADGTGYVIHSSIFEPRHTPSFWVAQTSFTWTQTSPSTLSLVATGNQTLAGGGEWGLRAKTKTFDLTATEVGLKLSGLGLEKATFLKYPGKLPAPMAQSITEETRAKALALGGNENPHQGPTFGQIAAGALDTYRKLSN